jgi:hypothetical protein
MKCLVIFLLSLVLLYQNVNSFSASSKINNIIKTDLTSKNSKENNENLPSQTKGKAQILEQLSSIPTETKNFMKTNNLKTSNLQNGEDKQSSLITKKNQSIKQFLEPSIAIKEIETHIRIKREKYNGVVYEKVQFLLKNGVFNQIVRKVSLAGTAGKMLNLKLAST